MTELKFCPLAPNLRQVVDILEVNLRRLLQDLPRSVQVGFRLPRRPTLLVELRKVNVQTMEVCGCAFGVDSRESLSVSLSDLLVVLTYRPSTAFLLSWSCLLIRRGKIEKWDSGPPTLHGAQGFILIYTSDFYR